MHSSDPVSCTKTKIYICTTTTGVIAEHQRRRRWWPQKHLPWLACKFSYVLSVCSFVKCWPSISRELCLCIREKQRRMNSGGTHSAFRLHPCQISKLSDRFVIQMSVPRKCIGRNNWNFIKRKEASQKNPKYTSIQIYKFKWMLWHKMLFTSSKSFTTLSTANTERISHSNWLKN